MNHYHIFETARGFCGIAWSDAGITRFQLPTRSAESTERLLLRRLPDGAPHEPPPRVAEAVAAVKDYFEGRETDFSRFDLDLQGQGAFFENIYQAARKIRGAARRPTAPLRRSSAQARRRPGMSAKRWRRIPWH